MKCLKVGITGGIGTGKSTVAKLFQNLQVPLYEADQRAKFLMANNTYLINSIKAAFGPESYIDGVLNRKFIAKEVFSDNEKLKILNNIVHPRIQYDFDKFVVEHSQVPYILKEDAILFETGGYKKLDKTIVVTADQDLRIRRVLARDSHRTIEDVLKIMNSQMSEEEKIEKADYIITNNEQDSHFIDLESQVLKLHQLFSSPFLYSFNR